MAGILVVGELDGDKLESGTGGLLALGNSLGDEVVLALIGQRLDSVSVEAIALGAHTVVIVQNLLMTGSSIDLQVSALEQICRQMLPSVVLAGRTEIGSDIGPRLAFRLGVGLAQDCVRVEMDSATGRVVATRPVFGGNVMARVTFPDTDPQVVVVRSGVYDSIQPDPSLSGKVEPIVAEIEPAMTKIRHVKTVIQDREGVSLEDASVVVCGGRGLGGAEPFETLKELASLLGGAVGGSRAVCDSGWLDHSLQIGLTGRTVAPDLYIAFGVSGASQHMAGCSRSTHIVAVNSDKNANIFSEAKYGVVGDWKEVLPAFLETVRQLT